MKKLTTIQLALFFVLIFTLKVNAQKPAIEKLPNVKTDVGSASDPFKYVYDGSGKKYELKDLLVAAPNIHLSNSVTQTTPVTGPGKGYSSGQTNSGIPSVTCSAGYFNLYFEASGLFLASPAARAVACQVYSDLSTFITAPSPMSTLPGVGPKINIYCGMVTGGLWGTGMSFYSFPNNPTLPNQGYTDGLVYKFLTTGIDPLSTIPTVFNNNTLLGGPFFHGYLAVANFMGPNPMWNVPLNLTPGANQADLYSVILHEAMHTLGFNSAISSTGLSTYGASNNYYNRYDKFLTDALGNPLLANTANPACFNSGLSYVGLPTDIEPGGGLCPSNCATDAKFMGGIVDEKVYTPCTFEPSESLSHFEDKCNGHPGPGGVCPPSGPGLYFVMNNWSSTGICYMKRYLKEEERQALCVLGYQCGNYYTCGDLTAIIDGANTPAYSHAYTSLCTPTILYGINDGLVNGTYIYATSGSNINIPSSLLLANDFPSSGLSVSCVEVVYSNTFNNASATMVGSNLSVNATAGSGLVIIKYYPDNGTDKGNATYVFVQFNSANCNSQTNCNLVQNGGFENITGSPTCGELGINLPATALNCWAPAEGDPAVFTRLCTANTTFELGVNTLGASPAAESFNGSPNNTVMGLNYVYGSTGTESLKNYLSAPLVPGISYDLSFMVLNPVSPSPYNYTGDPVVITVGAIPLFNSPVGSPYPTSSLEVIAQFVVPAGANWQQVTSTFVFNPLNNTNHQAIVIGINSGNTNALSTSPPPQLYCYIDEVSLIQTNNVSFSMYNPTLCGNTPYPNLAQYASGATGVFSGAGVSVTNGIYNFNAGTSPLPPGHYPVAFNYTINGCSYTLYQFVTISSNTNLLTLTQNVCEPSDVFNLTSLITNPAYIPGTTFLVNGLPATSPYASAGPGSYTITAINTNPSLCNNVATTVVHYYIPPATPFTLLNYVPASSTSICMGDNPLMMINAMGSSGTYQWQPNLPTGSFFYANPSPTVTTVYTVTAYNNIYCPSAQATFTLFVDPNCCTSSVPLFSGTTINGVYNTPLYFANDVTIPPGANVTLSNAEFLFGPNVKLIISPNSYLTLFNSHLYSCGPQMWKGIELYGDGMLISYSWGGNDNLIEDATNAIEAIAPTNTMHILYLQNTIFNKNHVDISVSNCNTNLSATPFVVNNCVFTCRDLPFTSTSWPSAASTGPGLRAPTGPAWLASPYLMQGYPITTLKIPYTGEKSQTAFLLTDVGTTTGFTYDEMLIGSPSTAAFYNVFDAHGNYINAERSNVMCVNNIFQNTQRYYATAISGIEGGTAILHTTNSLMNTSLELVNGSSAGNTFYECHKGVSGTNIYHLLMQGNTFRSLQNVSGGSAFLPGNTGVELFTNRMDYVIGNNVFSNIKDCIRIPLNSGTYDVGTGVQTGIYVSALAIMQNYFGAHTSSFVSPLTGQYTNLGINLTGPNGTSWSGTGSPINIYSNRVDRGYRGIRVDGLNGYTCWIKANQMLLADEPATVPQNGIEATNTQGGLTISDNLLVGPNKLNNNMNLFYLDNNKAPIVTCNTTKTSYNAFVFNGLNKNCTWKGNVMQNHARGLVLQNNGVIGQQGNSGSRSDNIWAGTWALPDYETYVTASNAASSVLYVSMTYPYQPINNSGVPVTSSYAAAGNIQPAGGSAYNCPNSGLPTPPQFRAAETALFELDQKNSFVSIFPNPSSGKVSIASDVESEAIGIVVSDLSGKKVFEQQLNTKDFGSEIFLDLDNGIYFIVVTKEATKQKTVRKLIISK